MTNITAISSEKSIQSSLILDARDIFSRERYEQRLDYQLAVLTEQFHKNKTVNRQQVKKVVEEFISDVEIILRKLEDAKRRAEQEEVRKIGKIRQLLLEGAKINSSKFKEEFERFGEALKSNTIAGLRQYRRREKRLKWGKAPLGYFLKKIMQDKALEMDVLRRTGSEVKEVTQEHQLASEVEFLINALNEKIPDKKTYEQLGERIKLLFDNYEKDLEDFLKIEVDIEIEEARKLHRIEHYVSFLKMVKGFDELIYKLNELKKKVEYWVYQDSIDAKKLIQYANTLNYGLSILKSSQASKTADFPGIVTANAPINNIVPGILIYNQNKPRPNRGIIIVHGIMTDKRYFLTLGKRLALEDYMVYVIDMTSHGESRENFRLGRNSEYILIEAQWFRLNGIGNVGVIGHSAGATSALFALCGYNTMVENQFYASVTKLIESLNIIAEKANKKESSERDKAVYEAIKLSEEYKKLKEVVLNGLKNMFKGKSTINATILLAAPLTFQYVFPPILPRMIRKLRSFWLTRNLVSLGGIAFTKIWSGIFKNPEGKRFSPQKIVAGKDEVQFRNMVISDGEDFLKYIETVKNPYDFINLVDFLCDNVRSPDKHTEFFRYYRSFIRKTPKLFIYGLNDSVIKVLKKNTMPELEKHYKSFGATEIVRYANVTHKLNEEGGNMDFETGKLPEMTYKIVTFLNSYLGKGRLAA